MSVAVPGGGAVETILSRVLGDGAVVSIGATLELGAAAVRVIDEPPDVEALSAALSSGEGPYDAAVAFAWGPDLAEADIARALRDAVRPGGVVAFASRLTGGGVGRRVIDLFARRRAVELETLCEALLLARMTDVRAVEAEGKHGVVWARVV